MGNRSSGSVPIDINWRRNIWNVSPGLWAWIYWLRVASSWMSKLLLIYFVLLLTGIDILVLASAVPVFVLFGLCCLFETVRFVLILSQAKLVFRADTEYNDMEEAAMLRARSILR